MSRYRCALWRDQKRRLYKTLHDSQSGLCPRCGGRLSPLDMTVDQLAHPFDRNTIDHVVPFALGGPDYKGNFLLVHQRCNQAKGSGMPTGCELVMLLAVNAQNNWQPARW